MAQNRKSRTSQKTITKCNSKHRSNHVRIIGGDWRGRKLAFPDIDGLRPTSDRMRETLFNWLAPHMAGARVIDLFAGSGALGLESLSRGAVNIVFVELNNLAATAIGDNLSLLNRAGLDAGCADLRQQSAFQYLQSAEPGSCDILFLDPPFANNIHNEILSLIASRQIMRRNAYIYIEAPLHTDLEIPANWLNHREKISGQVHYRLYQCRADPDEQQLL